MKIEDQVYAMTARIMETQVELENLQNTNRKYAQRIMTLETKRIEQYDKIVELEQALNCTTPVDLYIRDFKVSVFR